MFREGLDVFHAHHQQGGLLQKNAPTDKQFELRQRWLAKAHFGAEAAEFRGVGISRSVVGDPDVGLNGGLV